VKYAIFLNGPIGVGKTTLGRALAEAIGGGFIDGDDHAEPDKAWYACILRTSRSIVEEAKRLAAARPYVVIAYPLGRVSWIYYRRKMAEAGIEPLFVTLRASFAGIVAPQRRPVFSLVEQGRIKVMLEEGYAGRPFSDLILDTDRAPFAETGALLALEVRRLIAEREMAVSARE
jgi:hypothetical protein